MSRILKCFVLIVGILLSYGRMPAQTLHVIGFFNTNDPKIGLSVEKDQAGMNTFISDVSSTLSGLGYATKIKYFTGYSCSKASLVAALDSLKVKNDDVVLFTYSGHGARAMNDADLFPQMCLGERLQENYVPVSRVKHILVSKGGRLNLIITDCCNKQSEWVTSKPITDYKSAESNSSYLEEVCRKLFAEPGGNVVMTSSKVGEYSYGDSNNGGVFTASFISQWERVKNGEIKADWNAFCSAVQYDCSLTSIYMGRDQYTYQHPYFEIDKRVVSSSEGAKGSGRGNDSFKSLNQEVNQLLDKGISQSAKLKLINDIKGKYFSSGARIVTLLEDRNTIIRFEDASDFLERLALSDGISRIRFFKVENNKYSVYEYR